MNAVDTNVLVYLHDSRDPVKQAKSAALVTSLIDGVLLWQVACEYIAAARKLKHIGVPEEEIWNNLHLLRSSWRLVLPQWRNLDVAEQMVSQRAVSFWDALIIAVAMDCGVTTIYSEDLVGLDSFPGLRLINPFT